MARRGNGSGHGWGKGAGWGGPARGAGSGAAKAAPFAAGNRAALGEHDMGRSQRRQALLDMLFDLARTAASEEVQLAATIAWLNRFEGKPVAMTALASAADPSALTDAEHKVRVHAARILDERQRN